MMDGSHHVITHFFNFSKRKKKSSDQHLLYPFSADQQCNLFLQRNHKSKIDLCFQPETALAAHLHFIFEWNFDNKCRKSLHFIHQKMKVLWRWLFIWQVDGKNKYESIYTVYIKCMMWVGKILMNIIIACISQSSPVLHCLLCICWS